MLTHLQTYKEIQNLFQIQNQVTYQPLPTLCFSTYKSFRTVQGISKKQDEQVNILMKKAQVHTRALIHYTVTPGQAWIHYKMCFIPSVGYPLPIYHISNDDLHSLQKPHLMALKNKLCFYCRHHTLSLLAHNCLMVLVSVIYKSKHTLVELKL